MARRGALAGFVTLLALLVPASPAAALSSEFFGLSGWNGPGEQPEWNALGDAKIRTWRANMEWQKIEPNAPKPQDQDCTDPDAEPEVIDGERHCFFWHGGQPNGINPLNFDELVRKAAVAQVRILPRLYIAPNWAQKCPPYEPEPGDPDYSVFLCPPITDETNSTGKVIGHADERWKEFVAAAARRYGEGGVFWDGHPELTEEADTYLPVRWWQVWEEANWRAHWCAPVPGANPARSSCKWNARQYGEFVKDTHDAIAAEDPDANILLTGLPHIQDATLPETFLDSMYSKVSGIKSRFDAVGLHSYSSGKEGVRGDLIRARRVMKKYHDGKTKTWITEFGWATNGPDDDVCPKDPGVGADSDDTIFPCRYADQPEFQLVRITGLPTGGTFTLSFDGELTDPIPRNASDDGVEDSLEALPNLDPADVTVRDVPCKSPNAAYRCQYWVTFTDTFRGETVPKMSGHAAGLTGGSNPAVTVSRVKPLAQNVFVTDYAGQRKKLKKTLNMLVENRSRYKIGRVIWFGYRDAYTPGIEDVTQSTTLSWPFYTGLFFRDTIDSDFPAEGDPKPAWCGYLQITNKYLGGVDWPGKETEDPSDDCGPAPTSSGG
jgi:hypothetical protein